MIHTVNRLHVEDGHDIIAVDDVLFYFYTLDEWKDAGEETYHHLAASQFRHEWPLKRYVGCERH